MIPPRDAWRPFRVNFFFREGTVPRRAHLDTWAPSPEDAKAHGLKRLKENFRDKIEAVSVEPRRTR